MREFPTGIQKILAAPYQWTSKIPHQAELKPKALQVSIVSQQRSISAGHQPAAGSTAAQAAHSSKPGRQIGSISAAHKPDRQAFSADVYIYFANLGFILITYCS
jgi:hypothetical protein